MILRTLFRFLTQLIPSLLALASGVALLAPLPALAQSSGAISGRILNAATGVYLSGASVVVEGGAGLGDVSTEGGFFRVTDVPVGRRAVVVTYPGLDAARQTIEVPAGGSAELNFELTSKIYKLDAFTVSELREGEAAAVARQRTAENLKQVIATDTFGSVADANVGNVLLRLPGITAQRDEAEVHLISVRGIDPQFNSVMVDGTRLSGATTRDNGLSRAFEVDKVSTNSIESIEVIKAQLPEMDADAIGGAINLKTKSGFDRRGRDIRWAAGANIYQQRAVYEPSGSLAYSNVFGRERRLGLAFNASYNRTYGPRSAFRAGYAAPSFTVPTAMNDFQTSEDEITLTRIGTGLKLDYKLGPAASVFFNTLYNNYLDDMTQHKMRVRRGSFVAISDAISQMTNSSTEYEIESRYRTVKTFRFQFGGKVAWREWSFDGDAAWSPSDGFEKREDLTLRINGTAWRTDRTNRLHYPLFVQTGGPDIRNFDNGFTDGMNRKDFRQQDEIYAAQFNAKRTFATALPTSLKGGLRWREQTKEQNRYQPNYTYIGPDGVAGLNSATGKNDDNLNRFNGTDGHNYLPLDGRYTVVPAWPDLAAVHRELRANPQLFRENLATTIQNSLVNNGSVREEVLATYLQGNIDIRRFSLLAGVRREETTATAKGPVTDTRYANNAAEAALRFGGKVKVSRDYDNYFPSVHTRYRLAANSLVRASWSTGIGRAPYGQLIPVTTVNENAGTISRNNPGLNPQFSTNYDLSLEHYFGRGVGMVSVGAFQKNLRNFIFSATQVIPEGSTNGFDGLYGGYLLSTRVNGGWARVRGLEFNYQQSLSFLPGWLGGFGIFANGTRLVTRGTYDGTSIRTTIAGFVPLSANGGISWSRRGTTVRVNYNYTGENTRSYTANAIDMRYNEPRNPVDVSVKVRATRWFDVFVDASNVFNDKNNTFQGRGDRPIDSQIYGVRMAAGVSGAF
jgi:TonB-dependent receptor